MPDNFSDARCQVALANRILGNEGVLDAFGHVSLCHPNDPGRYLLARSRSPGLIESAGVLEFALDSEPVVAPGADRRTPTGVQGAAAGRIGDALEVA